MRGSIPNDLRACQPSGGLGLGGRCLCPVDAMPYSVKGAGDPGEPGVSGQRRPLLAVLVEEIQDDLGR